MSEPRGMNEAVRDDLEAVKQMLDEIYYATIRGNMGAYPWFVNKLTTISLLVDELLEDEK